jgi:TetR/AcrR family transcriptional regulator, transcriptional repressor for nem operon
VTDPSDTGAEYTRRRILHAAARQFAHRSYSLVSLDDILADAAVTKGAMYFHFRSKHALALAIIDLGTNTTRTALNELLARNLSGLESLIDFTYLMAARDIDQDLARAGWHLLESIGRTDGLLTNVMGEWVTASAALVGRAVAEGDVIEGQDPQDVSLLLVSLYAGIRQVSNLDEPAQFLTNLDKGWAMALPGFANPDRIEYFTQFVTRRTALAVNRASARQDLAGSPRSPPHNGD